MANIAPRASFSRDFIAGRRSYRGDPITGHRQQVAGNKQQVAGNIMLPWCKRGFKGRDTPAVLTYHQDMSRHVRVAGAVLLSAVSTARVSWP